VCTHRWASGTGSRTEAAGNLVSRSSASTSTIELSIDTEVEEGTKEEDEKGTEVVTVAGGNPTTSQEAQAASQPAVTTTESSATQQPLSSILNPHGSKSGHHAP
jgi:hypothetical protein